MLDEKLLEKLTNVYFSTENILKKSGGWDGYNIFYKPENDNIFLNKISISYENDELPDEKTRFKILKDEIKSRYNDKGWGLKNSIDIWNKINKGE